MDPSEARILIDSIGGDLAFARFLGLDEREGVAQRVNNWKRRGIPSSVVLAHYAAFKRLRAGMERAPSKRRA